MQLAQIPAFMTLAPRQRRIVYNSLVNGVIEGWAPAAEAVTLLCEYAAGAITDDEYRNRVLARLLRS
jgi:hypothetical protein